MELIELGPGIWAALQPTPLRFTDSNSLLVATREGTLIIDAQTDPRSVDYLLASFERLRLPPPRWLVYTHWHLDHTLGAAAYSGASQGQLEIIGHAALVEEGLIRSRTREQLEELRTGLRSAGRDELLRKVDVELLEPTKLVRSREAFELGGIAMVLHPVEAHTDGDLLVEFPELDLWATGDVLDALPFAGHGHPINWGGALSSISLGPNTRVLPGHGKMFEGPAQLERMRRYWGIVVEEVRAARARGESVEALRARLLAEDSVLGELRSELVVDSVSTRAFQAWLPEAVAKTWAELEENSAPIRASERVD